MSTSRRRELCRACLQPLYRNPAKTRRNKSGSYHPDCFRERSPKVIEIELDRGKGIRAVLKEEVSRYSSLEDSAAYMGITKRTLYKWVSRFFGMTMAEFMEAYATPERLELHRTFRPFQQAS